MSSKTYDFLKKIVPWLSFAAFVVGGFGEIWGIPYADKIAATITLVITGITTYLIVDSKKYFADKDIVTVPDYNVEKKG